MSRHAHTRAGDVAWPHRRATDTLLPPPPVERASVSLVDAARRLGVTRRTIYNRIRAGYLETVRVGASQRVLLASIAIDAQRDRDRRA